jgi:competence protein CoiA
MKFALVNGIRTEAFPKGTGKCTLCNGETIAKCGPKIIRHWAHKSLKKCDNWWENETQWHRDWKSYFPDEWQEVVHFDSSGEKHRADVKTAKGVVIEFQNSPMPVAEMQAREAFYGNMVWIVNGEKFQENFIIFDRLPDPKAKGFEDIVIHIASSSDNGRVYHKASEYDGSGMVEIYNLNLLNELVIQNYTGHHRVHWKNPRSVWFSAQAPVLFDFGDENLWRLMPYYPSSQFYCVKKYDKANFIKRANV